MYALIMVVSVPFVLLGAIVGLFSWEEHMLPSLERGGADARTPPIRSGAELSEAPGYRTLERPQPDPTEPGERSPLIARSIDHGRVDARPAGHGLAPSRRGDPAARHGRGADHLDPRSRPPGPRRNAGRHPR